MKILLISTLLFCLNCKSYAQLTISTSIGLSVDQIISLPYSYIPMEGKPLNTLSLGYNFKADHGFNVLNKRINLLRKNQSFDLFFIPNQNKLIQNGLIRSSFYNDIGFSTTYRQFYNENLYLGISLGLYARLYNKGSIVPFQTGNRLGLTSKIEFGYQLNHKFSISIGMRNMYDIVNYNKNFEQVLINNNIIDFTLKANVFEVFNGARKGKN